MDYALPTFRKLSPSSAISDRLINALQKFVDLAISGQLPLYLSPFLAGASLIPLEKQRGGVRPIAVGDSWRRLVAKVLVRRYQPSISTNTLNPLQLEVGTKAGAETIIHATQAALESSLMDSHALLQLDFRNAFNSVDRRALLLGPPGPAQPSLRG